MALPQYRLGIKYDTRITDGHKMVKFTHRYNKQMLDVYHEIQKAYNTPKLKAASFANDTWTVDLVLCEDAVEVVRAAHTEFIQNAPPSALQLVKAKSLKALGYFDDVDLEGLGAMALSEAIGQAESMESMVVRDELGDALREQQAQTAIDAHDHTRFRAREYAEIASDIVESEITADVKAAAAKARKAA